MILLSSPSALSVYVSRCAAAVAMATEILPVPDSGSVAFGMCLLALELLLSC